MNTPNPDRERGVLRHVRDHDELQQSLQYTTTTRLLGMIATATDDTETAKRMEYLFLENIRVNVADQIPAGARVAYAYNLATTLAHRYLTLLRDVADTAPGTCLAHATAIRDDHAFAETILGATATASACDGCACSHDGCTCTPKATQ